MEVQAGEGGMDAKLFVTDLINAYIKYAARNGIRHEVLDDEATGHVVVKFYGQGAGAAFRRENGRHVVQRIPQTETRGRRQTSVIAVAVLPLPPENTVEQLRDNDLEIIYQTGHQKAGGRNANCVNSAVRMKHHETGLSVFICGRDQGQNKKQARRILTARVNEFRHSNATTAYDKIRYEQLGNTGRGAKIRTYNFIDSRAVDHRTGAKTSNVVAVIEKGMFELLF